MGTFVCDKCHAYENSGTGWWHSRHSNQEALGPSYPDGEAYCSECAPLKYASGEPTEYNAKWHNRFPKIIATKADLEMRLRTKRIMTPLTQAVIDIIGSVDEVKHLYGKDHEK